MHIYYFFTIANASKVSSAYSNVIVKIRHIIKTAILATKVIVFLLEFKISLLEVQHVNEGTNDMFDIYTDAHPTLNNPGRDIKNNISIADDAPSVIW